MKRIYENSDIQEVEEGMVREDDIQDVEMVDAASKFCTILGKTVYYLIN